jgi:hypothetical protein
MADDASPALGAPQVAGVLVNPQGMAKKMTAKTAGRVVGGLAGSMAASAGVGDSYAGAPDVPDFGRVGFLCCSAQDIALVKTKTGALKMKVTDEVLARVARSQITAVDFDGGVLLSHLTITFANGVVWAFDVPKAGKKAAHALAAVLAPA